MFSVLHEGIYVAPQVYAEDVAAIAALGVRTVICHRPDGEEVGQPDFAPLAEKMRAAGIAHTYHQPIVGALMSEDDALILNHILHEAEFPVLMFCRTGTRCACVWSILQAMRGVSADELIAAAAQIQLDLSPLRVKLQNVETF
ncbi:MAG: TIGR01244 family sulfur transferase [Neisseria sp.]|nr:TIGR01244 family sulfur transferase [Neisseria sp.]